MELFIGVLAKFLVVAGFLMSVTMGVIFIALIYGVIYDYFHDKRVQKETRRKEQIAAVKTIAAIRNHTYKYDLDIK